MSFRRLVFAALLAAPLPAAAQQTSPQATPQATLSFPWSLNNPVAGNIYVGPYGPASFVSALGQASTLEVLCVDFLNEVNFGDHYAVNVTNLGGGGRNTVEDTRHPGDVATYRKAAWLGSLFSSTPTNLWGSVHYAVWNLFTPAQAPDDARSAQYLALADVAASNNYGAFDYQGAHYGAVDMTQYWVLTDVNAAGQALGGRQEFVVSSATPLGPSTTVPEPRTLLLFGSGGAVLAFLAWRRRRA